MRDKILPLKKAMRTALFVLLLGVVGLTNAVAQDITVGNLNYTINEDGTTVTLTGHVDGQNATGELIIPASVEFYGTSYAVTTIANNAFYNCTGLTGDLVIPNSVVTIANNAFFNCTSLTGDLVIPNSVVTIGGLSFAKCSGLTGSLTLSENVTYIGVCAFYRCGFSGTLTIPESVVNIYGAAFGHNNFTTLCFNANNCQSAYSYIDGYDFYYNYGISDFGYDYYSAFWGLSVTNLSIGENVQRIPDWAFRDFTGCTGNLVIPSSVTFIGDAAFYNSGYTGTLIIPDAVTTINSSAFGNCTGFTGSLNIPNSVTSIGGNAFSGCTGFTGTLTIGNAVNRIYANAFANTGFTTLNFNAVNCNDFNSSWLSGVTTLNTLNIGDNVQRIPDNFLTDFSSITGELTIPNAVTYIGASAFAGCTGLSGTLTLGMSLINIANSAFFGSCANFTSMVLRTQVPPTLGNNVFTSASADIPVKVPCGTLEAYQAASVWGNFVNLQEIDPCEWTITVSSNAAAGTVNGAGIYTQGSTCVLTAVPNDGFTFVNWTENGQEVSTNAQYSFTVQGDRNLVAHFSSPNFIVFTDPVVESICLNTWDANGDGLLSYTEAAAVTDIGQTFRYWESITSFDELQYFTGLTYIGYQAFYYCTSLSLITLPDNITSIGDYAFYYCTSLSSIILPDNITSIGQYAFFNCANLSSIILPENLISISYYAFAYCTNLTEFTIPESVTSVSNRMFYQCNQLTVLNFNASNIEGWSWYWLSTCPSLTVLNIGENVQTIPEEFFHETSFTTVNFNATNCTSMYYVFENCNALTTLNIGQNVQRIPEYAFVNCSGFTGSLVIPASTTQIDNGAFWGCSGFTGELILPNTLTSVGHYAFCNCSGFSGSFVIPNTVTSIGEGTFQGCSGLTGTLTIPEAVTSIGGLAFAGTGFTALNFNAVNCGSLAWYGEYNGNWDDHSCMVGLDMVTTLNIGANVQTIPEYAFINFSGVTGNLTLPNSVTTIGNRAFQNCSGFTGILTIPESVTSIGNSAFSGCSGFTGALTIPEAVTFVGNYAFTNTNISTVNYNAVNCNDMYYCFNNCNNLTTLNIGNSVQTIPEQAFYGCGSLSGELVIPESVNTIGNNAFRNCSGFTGELTLPESVTSIGNHAFYGCTGFTGDLVIPDAVNIVGSFAFYDCSGLNGTVTIGEAMSSIGVSVFSGTNFNAMNFNAVNCKVHYSSGTAFSGCNSITQLNFGENVQNISNNAFRDLNHLTGTLTLPNSLKSIGDRAFYNCYGLEGLVMGNSVETIGAEAFYGCGGLRGELTMPETLQTVGNHAFASCDQIVTINYKATNCQSMGNAQQPVFYDCASIAQINISDNVESIPEYAFKRCSTVTAMNVAAVNPPVIQPSTFSTVSRAIPVTVPFGSGTVYRSAPYWEEFFNIIEGIGQSPYYNHWATNIYQFPDNMNFIGVIQIDGVEQTSEALEIGAFCGDVCRGSQLLTNYPQLNRSMVFFTIYGTQGDLITFRLYNHELEKESVLGCTSIVTFEPDGMMGTYAEPHVFNFTSVQNTIMNEGWTWYSSYVGLNGSSGLQMMEDGLGENGILIKSQRNGFVTYDEGLWMGSLSSLNNESMYLVNVSASTVLSMAADFVSPAQHAITLAPGWTWAGYPSASAADINEAFSNLNAVDNDMVKSQGGFATYAEGIGWVGSLNKLVPGAGLMYNSKNNQTVSFVYNEGAKGGVLRENVTADGNHYVPKVSAYPYNMNMMAVVELDGSEVRSGEFELAVFAGDECRGSVRLLYVEALDRYIAFLTVVGDEAATLTMRLVDTETGMEYESEQCFVFETNAVIGSLKEPVALRFNATTTACDTYLSEMQLYPNPVKANESLNLNLPINKEVRVEVVNALGAVVSAETVNSFPASVKAPKTPGIYMVKVSSDEKGSYSYKLIVR